jgi:serine/threonine-protein kinase RsbW
VRATQLPACPAAARQSRELLTQELATSGWAPERIDIARLLISELATNAVLHADTEHVRLVIDLADGVLSVHVGDQDRRLPARRAASEADERGRGLSLVAALADEWGVVAGTDARDKTVWFRIRSAPSDH